MLKQFPVVRLLKFLSLALALSITGSAFAASRAPYRRPSSRDAKIACSTGRTFEQAQYGISLSAASYAKAGYRVSAPTMRKDRAQVVMCIAVARG